MSSRLTQWLILGGLTALVLLVIVVAVLVAWIDRVGTPVLTPTETVRISQATPVPTFTATPTPSPVPPTLTPTLTPSSTPTPTLLPTPTVEPSATPTATATPLPPPTAPPAPVDPPTATPPPVDFVVVQQRMRSNEENSVLGKVANNCGGDHTIYVQVVDAAGNPLPGIIVGDTYKNVRSATGTDGPGRLKIELWSNTMALEVQGNIDGTPYTSLATVPLSTRDEDIPAEWLFAGGYCGSLADCQLRQQTNGLCRGHYSYDVTFQRTW